MVCRLFILVRATCRVQGLNAIRYENVAMDGGFGQE